MALFCNDINSHGQPTSIKDFKRPRPIPTQIAIINEEITLSSIRKDCTKAISSLDLALDIRRSRRNRKNLNLVLRKSRHLLRMRAKSLAYFSDLKLHTSLSAFSTSFQSPCSVSGLTRTFQSLRPLTCLSKIHLEFKHDNTIIDEKHITDDNMIVLSRCLRYPFCLLSLHLEFFNCFNLTDEGIESLSLNLRHLPHLSDLILCFGDCGETTDFSIDALSTGLTHLSSLRLVRLAFSNLEYVTDESFRRLSLSLKFLDSLQSVALCFLLCCRITDDSMESFSECFGCLTSISKLYLNFEGSSRITDLGFSRLSSSFQHLVSLSEIYLNFRGNKFITNLSIQNLAADLKGLVSLSTINLDFNCFRGDFKIAQSETD